MWDKVVGWVRCVCDKLGVCLGADATMQGGAFLPGGFRNEIKNNQLTVNVIVRDLTSGAMGEVLLVATRSGCRPGQQCWLGAFAHE